MDNDTEELRACRCRSYRASWFGFALYGSYLAVTALFALASDFSLFVGGRRNIGGLLGIDSFERHFDTFRTWARLLACFGLAAAWPDDASWRRRARLLLVLAIGDVALWAALAAVPLGLATEPTRHAFLFDNLRMALGWSRYLLLASLAADLATGAGTTRGKDLGKAARSTAATGAAIWFGYFLLSRRLAAPLAARAAKADHRGHATDDGDDADQSRLPDPGDGPGAPGRPRRGEDARRDRPRGPRVRPVVRRGELD